MKLIYKVLEVEVFKDKKKPEPYIFKLGGEEMLTFSCDSDEDVPAHIDFLLEVLDDVINNPDSELKSSKKHTFNFKH